MKKTLEQFINEKLRAVRQERDALNKKLANLELAVKLLLHDEKKPDPASRASKKTRIFRDKLGVEKTASFLKSRAKPTTVEQVAKEFKISSGAAGGRLSTLTMTKRARRVERGTYVHWNTPTQKSK